MTEQGQKFGIEPLNVPTNRSAAADQLRQLIESDRFRPGERLPSERDLADLLGVGRTTIREAKSTLEALGLIETRQGSGSYVTSEVSQDSLSSMWHTWYAAHHHELLHLLQVREALETKAALLAAAKPRPKLVAQMRDVLKKMRFFANEGDTEEVAQLDARFHGLIAAASGNPILVQLLSSLDAVLANDRVAVFNIGKRLERSLEDHQAIVTAIAHGEPRAVYSALQAHFESVVQDVEALSPESMIKAAQENEGDRPGH